MLEKSVRGILKSKNSASSYVTNWPGKYIFDGKNSEAIELNVVSTSYDPNNKIVKVMCRGGNNDPVPAYYKLNQDGDKLFSFSDGRTYENDKLIITKADFNEFDAAWMEQQIRDHMVFKRFEANTFKMQQILYAKKIKSP